MKLHLLTALLVFTCSGAYAEAPTVSTDVIVVTAPYCGWCEKIKKWMNEHEVTYTEYDSDSKIGDKLYRQYKGNGVPLTIIDGKVVRGYDTEKLSHLVNEKRFLNEQSPTK